eukprot:27922-Eustigmatos_ZCMA.PRE.1
MHNKCAFDEQQRVARSAALTKKARTNFRNPDARESHPLSSLRVRSDLREVIEETSVLRYPPLEGGLYEPFLSSQNSRLRGSSVARTRLSHNHKRARTQS